VATPSVKGDVVATVNGEPIYREQLETTLALVPAPQRTDDLRESLLNQTIDLLLLKQEAQRRGITVDEAAIDTRVETILNDTGKSPQELRIILAENNLTVPQFRETVREMLLVEAVTASAIDSRISVTEQEVLGYYSARRAEFLPPPGGVRVSHILLGSDTDARSVIAALDRGESFRDLALARSLDAATAAAGGALGTVVSGDGNDPAFVAAALRLRENQYTTTPVRTSAGYHVIIRNFDLLPIPVVREQVRATLLAQKRRAAFAAFIEGLRAQATVRLYTASGVVTLPRVASLDAFASCVGARATLYGAPWSAASESERLKFGDAAMYITAIDCDADPASCASARIERYPTWVVGTRRLGASSLAELADATDCPLPRQ
jgi:foldase protein PrsA